MKPETNKGRPALSRRVVVEAALASADAGGLKAVSFRNLAAELGVTPMSLYRYVDSKEALLDAIADRVFEELELPADDSADWRVQMRHLAHSYRRLLLAHPAVAALRSAATPPLSLNAARAVEAFLRILGRAGFSAQEAALLEIQFETFVLAHVMLETGGGTPPPSYEEQSARTREIRARLLTLPPDEFPHLVEAASYLSEAPDPDWAFELGLDLLIGGFEKILNSEHNQTANAPLHTDRTARKPTPEKP